jgi:hypothetical protein
MLKFKLVLLSCAVALVGMSSASAAIPTPAYVDAQGGADSGTCTLAAPCATLNFALNQISAGGQIIFLKPGVFGPIILTGKVAMSGISPSADVQIVADPSLPAGCIGAAAGSCGTNHGYAVEIAAGSSDTVKLSYLLLNAGPNGTGALKFTSGGKLQLTHSVYRGNSTTTSPIISLNPTNAGTTQAQVYFSNSDIGFNNSTTNAGAVECVPGGQTSLKLHFNHVEVHNASYGIRTDGSNLTTPSATVATFISESEFFSFNNAAVNAFSTGGTGTVNAVFDTTRILNAGVALKANGAQSFVILTNNTVSGNSTGIQVVNGATVITSGNNTVFGNGTNVIGTLTPQALQ